jgi:hypothetical protein
MLTFVLVNVKSSNMEIPQPTISMQAEPIAGNLSDYGNSDVGGVGWFFSHTIYRFHLKGLGNHMYP